MDEEAYESKMKGTAFDSLTSFTGVASHVAVMWFEKGMSCINACPM